MENEQTNYDEGLDEIGYLARKIDTEMTVFERMKIKKSTLYRIFLAMGIYATTMTIFILAL